MCSSPMDLRIAEATDVFPEPVPPAIATTRTGRSNKPLEGDGMLFPVVEISPLVVSSSCDVVASGPGAVITREAIFIYFCGCQKKSATKKSQAFQLSSFKKIKEEESHLTSKLTSTSTHDFTWRWLSNAHVCRAAGVWAAVRVTSPCIYTWWWCTCTRFIKWKKSSSSFTTKTSSILENR